MKTLLLLAAQYDGRALIPIETVVRDYFPHLSPNEFLRKQLRGDIKLAVTRIDPSSQKSAKGVHLEDLAAYIDARRAAATKEAKAMYG